MTTLREANYLDYLKETKIPEPARMRNEGLELEDKFYKCQSLPMTRHLEARLVSMLDEYKAMIKLRRIK